jgi:hypothetical protein
MNLGAFREYIIEINYEKKYITFYDPAYFRKSKNLDDYTSLYMEIRSGSPHVDLTIVTDNGSTYPVKLMLDTGAGNALHLDTSTLPGYSLPEGSQDCYLGWSINGNVKGKVGRMKQVKIGPYSLRKVLVSHPDPQEVKLSEHDSQRNGSLGAEFLRRFHMIIDYPAKMVHILPNEYFHQEFRYDMSGLEIMVPIPDEHRYIICGIRKGSNAELAGIHSGDEILAINGTPSSQHNLNDIYSCLCGSNGKMIRLELLREDKRISVNLRLEKYI